MKTQKKEEKHEEKKTKQNFLEFIASFERNQVLLNLEEKIIKNSLSQTKWFFVNKKTPFVSFFLNSKNENKTNKSVLFDKQIIFVSNSKK